MVSEEHVINGDCTIVPLEGHGGTKVMVYPISWRLTKQFTEQAVRIGNAVVSLIDDDRYPQTERLRALPPIEDIKKMDDGPDRDAILQEWSTLVSERDALQRKQMLAALPPVIRECMDLVEGSVVFPDGCGLTIDDVYHYEMAPIVEAWFVENLGDEKKVAAWKQTIETISGVVIKIPDWLQAKIDTTQAA